MTIRHHTTHTFEHYERSHDTTHIFPLPFDTEGDPEHIYISENGLRAVLAFLVPDGDSSDPFTEYDEGEFIQFNHNYIHHGNQPDTEAFKRIIRANPGRVFTVGGYSENYYTNSAPLDAASTRNRRPHDNESSPAAECLNDARGYYIAPADATDPAKYADGSLNTYNQWAAGEVYGVIVWTYTRDSIADNWTDPDRDNEVWGFYGCDGYTAEELKSQFIYAVTQGAPSREARQ